VFGTIVDRPSVSRPGLGIVPVIGASSGGHRRRPGVPPCRTSRRISAFLSSHQRHRLLLTVNTWLKGTPTIFCVTHAVTVISPCCGCRSGVLPSSSGRHARVKFTASGEGEQAVRPLSAAVRHEIQSRLITVEAGPSTTSARHPAGTASSLPAAGEMLASRRTCNAAARRRDRWPLNHPDPELLAKFGPLRRTRPSASVLGRSRPAGKDALLLLRPAMWHSVEGQGQRGDRLRAVEDFPFNRACSAPRACALPARSHHDRLTRPTSATLAPEGFRPSPTRRRSARRLGDRRIQARTATTPSRSAGRA
jgi:hypothetical protein